MKIFKGTIEDVEEQFNNWKKTTNFVVTHVAFSVYSENEIILVITF